jgi:hypothetical protein
MEKPSPPPLPTLAEFRSILVRDFGCYIQAPIRNLLNSPKQITFITRAVREQTLEWLAYLDDEDRITGEIALNACRCLQIPPEEVELPDSDSAIAPAAS